MTEKQVIPTLINLHKKSRLLEIKFSDDFSFNYPCEFLRVIPPDFETQSLPVAGKQQINITHLVVANESTLEIQFDDNSQSEYTWDRLYELGNNYQHYWQNYLSKLKQHQLSRGDQTITTNDFEVTVYYFIQLAKIAGLDQEQITLPAEVNTVEKLLTWLAKRGQQWQQNFNHDHVQVTVNKNFAELFTPIEANDEIAIVPMAENSK